MPQKGKRCIGVSEKVLERDHRNRKGASERVKVPWCLGRGNGALGGEKGASGGQRCYGTSGDEKVPWCLRRGNGALVLQEG